MIRLLAPVALLVALHPAARPEPRDPQAAIVAGGVHQARVALPVVNGLGSALPSRSTRLAPPALSAVAALPVPLASRSWRPRWSARLLL
jgi:hypothetical protein